MQKAKSKKQGALCLLLFAFCTASVSLAADISLTAALDKTRMALNEQAVLSVTISGNVSNLPEPQLPGLAAFQVQNAGTSQSYSWVNGQTSASVTHSYVLTPKQEGQFTIPPVRLAVEGKTLESNSLNLEVVKGNAAALPPAQPGAAPAATATGAPPAFVASTVDKTGPYVGEAVIYTFRLYSRAAFLRQPQYQPPDTSGFWTEDLPPQRNFQTAVKGVPYQVVEVKTALFPTHAGKAIIGPATLNVVVQNFSADPFVSFFNDGENRVLRTDTITLQAKPLPTPEPAGFRGAVGSYTLKAELDKTSITVGQPVTLTLSITGQGNIKSLPDLPLPPLANFRTFDANAATNVEKKDYHVQGSKVFKTVLIPTTSGTLPIPPMSFVYFDPAAHTYKTVISKPLEVRVQPAPAGSSVPNLSNAGSNASAPGIKVLNQDIRYIKTPSALKTEGPPLYKSKSLIAVNALAFLGLILSASVPLYRKARLSNPVLRRFRSAKDEAKKGLQDVESSIARNDVARAGGLLTRILQTYLAAKLGIAEGGLSLKQVTERLTAAGASPAAIQYMRRLWETFDLYQFAPAKASAEDLKSSIDVLRRLIGDLEKDLKWKG